MIFANVFNECFSLSFSHDDNDNSNARRDAIVTPDIYMDKVEFCARQTFTSESDKKMKESAGSKKVMQSKVSCKRTERARCESKKGKCGRKEDVRENSKKADMKTFTW